MDSVSRKQPRRFSKVELRRDKLIRRRRRSALKKSSESDADKVGEIRFEVSDDSEPIKEEEPGAADG